MKCMCAQTRPRFILSYERVFGGMEFEPMSTPREKSPLPENFPRGGSNPRRCGQRAQTLPTSYSDPHWMNVGDFNSHSPSWDYPCLDAKEEVKHWIVGNRLVLINTPTDPQPSVEECGKQPAHGYRHSHREHPEDC